MAKKKSGIPGLSFSIKRATGVSSAKQKIARQQEFQQPNRGVEIK